MTDNELIKAFISHDKSMLIAPAGYGKTHTIAQCIKKTTGKQLILTHTNAGVAAIKEKIHKQKISPEKYHVETISGYAQKYVRAFYMGKDSPKIENRNKYWTFIVKKAQEILSKEPCKKIIKVTYSGLFVDEYQDCTLSQHELIKKLSSLLPTRILGDPLQGIFGFKDPLVDLNSDNHMKEFKSHTYELEEPWRWKGNNEKLGEALKEIRKKLKEKKELNLSLYKEGIDVHKVDNKNTVYKPSSKANKKMWSIKGKEENLLIIHPISGNINPRKKITSIFKVKLLEAIEEEYFYELAKDFDEIAKDLYSRLRSILVNLYGKSNINTWFGEKNLVKKKDPKDQTKIKPIKEIIDKLKKNLSFGLLAELIENMKTKLGLNVARKELVYDLIKALKQANDNNSVYDAMVKIRNEKRAYGRKIHGKCVGTTLLTKGLEFDTVIVLNVNQFKSSKNLYVALTRASKRLVVFTNNMILNPYKKDK